MLWLTDENTTDTFAILEEIKNGLDFSRIQFRVPAEREVEEPPVGKATNPLLQKVEHLGTKRFQDQDSSQLFPVSQSG